MGNCRVCGTMTGIHGFSFDDEAIEFRNKSGKFQPKASSGVLFIPLELEFDEEAFMRSVPNPPEIKRV